jgi:hypothetical protein
MGPDGKPRIIYRQVAVAVPSAEAAPRQILCKLQIIADRKGDLATFEQLNEGHHLIGDAQTIQGMLRILAKNSIIRTISSPSLVCSSGRSAQFFSGATVPGAEQADPPRMVDGTQVDITATEVRGETQCVLNVRLAQNGKTQQLETAVNVGPGQAVIWPFRPGREKAMDGDPPRDGSDAPLYIVLTAEPIGDPTFPTPISVSNAPAQPAYLPQPAAPAAAMPYSAAPAPTAPPTTPGPYRPAR